MKGPMDLVANVAVGATGLGIYVPLVGRVSADPAYFLPFWEDCEWNISKIGWQAEEKFLASKGVSFFNLTENEKVPEVPDEPDEPEQDYL
jgi:hypothetical protein